MSQFTHYESPKLISSIPNRFDIAAIIIIFAILASLAWAAGNIATPYETGIQKEISLDPLALPGYAARTVLRMFIALFFSFLFTLIIAPIAAKYRQAEKLMLPLIDILQSIPVLGMLSITIVGFIQLFPNSTLGPECAAIFAIFTSQVWNMTLSFYQSLKMMPKDLYDTAAIFHLSAWQRFWRIELPRAIPGLLWNAMISLSGGWFFVVAAEAISVSNQNIFLPGIGSYIHTAIAQQDLHSVAYAITTMLIVILLYDQLLFRPLLTWALRFNIDSQNEEPIYQSWFYRLLTKTRWLNKASDAPIGWLKEHFINTPVHLVQFEIQPIFTNFLPNFFKGNFISKEKSMNYGKAITTERQINVNQFTENFWNIILFCIVVFSSIILFRFVAASVSFSEVGHVFFLGAITGFKVAVLVILACIVWIPVGVWIGLNPRLSPMIQPVIQFIAAFPANLIYPIAVTLIVYYHLNVNIWSSPLMILGTQWYILFNVVAATQMIPKELQMVAQNFSLTRFLWWKRIILPAIFPYTITGAMAAAAGSWNASIVADVLSWGDKQLVSVGLGSYIVEQTTSGDFPRIALGVFVMCCYVLIINRLVWSKLYHLASTRYVLE